MEVSTLRDRRLVALLATLVIGGAGVAAAVVSLEQSGPYGSRAATRAVLGLGVRESRDPPPVIGAVVTGDAPTASTDEEAPVHALRAPAPDLCTAVDSKHRGKSHDHCAKPPKPEPEPEVEIADAGPAPRPLEGVVAASDPEPRPAPKPRHGARTK